MFVAVSSPILVPIGTPTGAQDGPNMDPKSKKKRQIEGRFRKAFYALEEPTLVDFGGILVTPEPQKWVSRVGAVLFLRISRFSGQMRF